MLGIIIEVSRYFFLLCSFYFIFACFKISKAIRLGDEDSVDFYSRGQKIAILFSNMGGFIIVMWANSFELRYLLFYIEQTLFFLVSWFLVGILYKKSHVLIWNLMFYFLNIGFIVLTRLNLDKGIRQFRMALFGMALALVMPYIVKKWKWISKLNYIYYVIGFGLLLLVNDTVYGAKNWFTIGNFSFQPSEFVKIFYCLWIASFFRKGVSKTKLLISAALSGALVLILVYQRDLGGALIFFMLFNSIVYIQTAMPLLFVAGLIAAGGAGFVAYKLFYHVRERIEAWINPWADINDKGYQMAQSLFAISAGGWVGAGLTKGMPQIIPVHTNDFIFSAICEEFGAIFGLFIIAAVIFLFISTMQISVKVKDSFTTVLTSSIAVFIMFQSFLNIGGVIKFVPSTGVTLPFVSYGGTSLVASFIAIGIIQGAYLKGMARELREQEQFEYEQDIHQYPMETSKEKTKDSHSRENKTHKVHIKAISTLRIIFACLFICLGLFLLKTILFADDDILIHVDKRRLDKLEESMIKGKILDQNGNIIAQTIERDGELIRVYPYENAFAHVVGFVGHGKYGLEETMNMSMLQSHRFFLEKMYTELIGHKQIGDNVITTLDADLQVKAYELLGKQKGAIIALEPSTGKILCCVSKPDFDPNQISLNYEQLSQNENSPFINRAFQGKYPPGSTFKVLTALQYMMEFPYDEFSYVCEGKINLEGKVLHCYNKKAHGTVDLEHAFAYSCNTAFAYMGEMIDIDELNDLTEDFLFNTRLPFEMTSTISQFDLDKDDSAAKRAETVIGQGLTMITPLHNAMIIATIANDGVMMEPYLVDRIENADGKTITQYFPNEYKRIVNEEYTDILKDYMCDVVNYGTGTYAASSAYQLAGKTGSAENPFGADHGWFIGFAPADNPKIAIAIVVENSGGSGNVMPIVKALMDEYLID